VREARAAAAINHPNIVQAYAVGEDEGLFYFAMEYVQGSTLKQVLVHGGRLVADRALAIAEQVVTALDYAWRSQGLIHRDIKPDNILIAKGGLVKLTDFGLAKAEDSRMTRTGVVMGTPSYMSPEQVLGKDADARSDIYSMGLVLYECLTGDTVFVGENVLERQLKEMPPPPGSVVEGVPPEMDTVIMKAIAKEPPDRFQTVRDFTTALRALSL